MTETIHKGKVCSFWELLSTTKIEVPIIQRDYAQGRKNEREIRDNFLTALFNSLSELKPIKLDFVYGSIEKDILQPLDGQQRLTTLFLLHWYSCQLNNDCSEEVKKTLLNFSYETRISSREFCTALVNNDFHLGGVETTLRDKIIDSPWFVLSWEKDPTIDAMLRMIDDIHERFQNVSDLWTKLIEKDCLIQFYHVELRNIGLTDDLYIKMNARGKLLSPYENFKASFQKYINDQSWEANTSLMDSFALKIDTVWTDLLWSHRKGDSIDEAFMRFASAIAMIRLSIERADNRIFNISALQENPNKLPVELISNNGFKYLVSCFDLYSEIDKSGLSLELDINLWQHKPIDTIFTAIVYEDNLSSTIQRNSATYTQKVLFFAQTEYLRRVKDFNQDSFTDWMRVVRNIISRGDVTKYGDRPAIIRSPQAFDGVINLISELSEGCENIISYLSTLPTIKSAFAREQIEEEILKARLISNDINFKEVIINLEENNLLRGRIAFPLYVADYHDVVSFVDLELLKKIENVLKVYFNNENELPEKFRAAMLTIEDNNEYKYYNYWWSFWNVANADKRCLIDKYRELEYYIDTQYNIYFKKLVLALIDRSFEQIIEDFDPPVTMSNWKIRLIKEPYLLKHYCKSNYIAIPEDEECCYLLKSMRPRDILGCEIIS
ncbi:Protein of uncharacterised function DUF262 [Chryseobacterium nakagawai]|uniref:DUF262 domain-containing protein n=1 Tax=Chryseobacterium nakagawai TaxID=1241982 RepID=A0AAD1DSC6_CHRNA|nr:DUF262 domain-containing protein [Chryseobacterium nakagawai]AZA91774.1 DUF262 domain-containing protein [Chryseobacterium nakagawai]VEH18284.1 Protein of uncharacterised function DUF262 [Chryseobacterium nakagawai]